MSKKKADSRKISEKSTAQDDILFVLSREYTFFSARFSAWVSSHIDTSFQIVCTKSTIFQKRPDMRLSALHLASRIALVLNNAPIQLDLFQNLIRALRH